MSTANYRRAIAEFIQREARPIDKFSHQPRLYQLAASLGKNDAYDDDVLYAAAWMHDIGVFVGHRPSDPAALQSWDNVAYAVRVVPDLLRTFDFPTTKIPLVIEAIRTHLPSGEPTLFEGVLLRDADILEQLGAIAILRTVSKVGRDTRYSTHQAALRALHRQVDELPKQLRLPRARELAEDRIAALNAFLRAAAAESGGLEL